MRTVAALCVIAVALGGCGGASSRDSAEEFKGEERSVAKTIDPATRVPSGKASSTSAALESLAQAGAR